MGRRLTQADALARFRETHGDRYDYSQVEYVHSMTKVVVICREHGPFEQAPSSHWNGQGCPRCARRRQTGAPPQPWAEIEQRLIEVHNGRYTYDGTGYRDTNSKITATCPKHGDFRPQVASHLRGKYGCRKCSYLERGEAKRLSFEDWLQRAREKFGYRFQYDPWSWDTHANIGMKRLRLQCPEHGWQETNPVNHLNSPLGCPACGNFLAGEKRRLTTEEFIERARAQHGDKYSYERTAYRHSDEKLIVTCPEHGDYWTLPHNHLKAKLSVPDVRREVSTRTYQPSSITSASIPPTASSTRLASPITRFGTATPTGRIRSGSQFCENGGTSWAWTPSHTREGSYRITRSIGTRVRRYFGMLGSPRFSSAMSSASTAVIHPSRPSSHYSIDPGPSVDPVPEWGR